jgi:hypothetical protein
MFKRFALPALASALVLAAAGFSSASAGHFRGGHFSRGASHTHHYSQRHYFGQRRVVHRPVHWRFASHGGHWRHGSHGWHWRHASHGGTVYLDGGYVPVGGGEPYPVTGAAPACGNCLGKEYLQDGSVRFFDRCTQESAIAVPAPSPRG